MGVIVGIIGVRMTWILTLSTNITSSLTIGLASLSTLKRSQKIAHQIERAILRIRIGMEVPVNGIDD
jgi:hypothetical protein